jgi:hypothetical protein
MSTDQFKNLYRTLLMKFGVSSIKAEEACKNLTFDDMRIISEIWPEWQAIFSSEKV